MQRLYHEIWLLRDRMFYIALAISVFWHIGLFSVMHISNINTSSQIRSEVRLQFLQNKWIDKSVELPGKEFKSRPDDIFTQKSFVLPESFSRISKRLSTLTISKNEQAALDLKGITKSNTLSDHKDYLENPVFSLHTSLKKEHVHIQHPEMDEIQLSDQKDKIRTPILSQEITGPAKKRIILQAKEISLPDWTLNMGLKFTMDIRFWLARTGSISSVIIETSSGYAEIDALIIKNVKSWRFEPSITQQENTHQWGIIHFTCNSSVNNTE